MILHAWSIPVSKLRKHDGIYCSSMFSLGDQGCISRLLHHKTGGYPCTKHCWGILKWASVQSNFYWINQTKSLCSMLSTMLRLHHFWYWLSQSVHNSSSKVSFFMGLQLESTLSRHIRDQQIFCKFSAGDWNCKSQVSCSKLLLVLKHFFTHPFQKIFLIFTIVHINLYLQFPRFC